jgi:hypothetical protein
MSERVTSLGDGMNVAINAVIDGAHFSFLLVFNAVILFITRWREHERRVTKGSKAARDVGDLVKDATDDKRS